MPTPDKPTADRVFDPVVSRPSGRQCVWLAVVAVVLLCLGACDAQCGAGDTASPSKPKATWPLDIPISEKIPSTARATIIVRELDDLVWAVRQGRDRLPEGAVARVVPPVLTAFATSLKTSTGIAGAFGLAPQKEAALFHTDESWGFVATLDSQAAFKEALDRLGKEDEITVDRAAEGRWQLNEPSSGTRLEAVLSDGFLVVAPGRADSDSDDTPSLAKRFLEDFEAEETPTWPRTSANRELLETLAKRDGQLRGIGLLEPGAWLEEIDAPGQSGVILSRMANQLGTTALRLDIDASRSELTVDLHNRSDPGEPIVIDGVGTAEGELPALGGLIEPGVLGVVRFSIDPQAVYKLLVSTLPPAQRRQLKAFWRQMRDKLLLEGPEKILENFNGHVVLVFYGLDSESLSADQGMSLRRVLELKTTREAILLPIKSRKKAERLLDKMTQITQGRLSRQRGEHTVQYAWFNEGELDWAFILSDEHIIFVDSATAFGQAMQFERRGRPLAAEEIDKLGIGPLLERRERSGIYLDTGTLANLLSENGRDRAAEWLAPFQSVLLTTEMDGDVSKTRLYFRF